MNWGLLEDRLNHQDARVPSGAYQWPSSLLPVFQLTSSPLANTTAFQVGERRSIRTNYSEIYEKLCKMSIQDAVERAEDSVQRKHVGHAIRRPGSGDFNR
jgi:hypothetical protein